jgi:hypothetical protein
MAIGSKAVFGCGRAAARQTNGEGTARGYARAQCGRDLRSGNCNGPQTAAHRQRAPHRRTREEEGGGEPPVPPTRHKVYPARSGRPAPGGPPRPSLAQFRPRQTSPGRSRRALGSNPASRRRPESGSRRAPSPWRGCPRAAPAPWWRRRRPEEARQSVSSDQRVKHGGIRATIIPKAAAADCSAPRVTTPFRRRSPLPPPPHFSRIPDRQHARSETKTMTSVFLPGHTHRLPSIRLGRSRGPRGYTFAGSGCAHGAR